MRNKIIKEKSKPSLAMVIYDDRPRGAQIVAYNLYLKLQDKYNITFYGKENKTSTRLPISIKNIDYSMNELLSSDIIHLHYSGAYFKLNEWDKASDKLIVTTHQLNNEYSGPCKYHVVVTQMQLLNHNERLFIPNPLPAYEPNIESAKRLVEKPYYLTIGTYHPQKGPDIFVNVCKESLQRHGFGMRKFIFVGTSDNEGDYMNIKHDIFSLNMQGMFISTLGVLPVDICSGLIKGCHAYIHTSKDEASSLSLIEAQLYEKPVFALNIPGNRQTVSCGTLINEQDFASKIFEHEDVWYSDYAKKLRKENSLLIQTMHGNSHEKYDELYQGVLENA